MLRRCLALPFVLAALTSAGAASPAAAQDHAGLLRAVEALEPKLTGSRAAVHKAKRELISEHFTAERSGVAYATVFLALDCVSTSIQQARGSSSRARSLATKARGCMTGFTRALAAGGAPAAVRADAKRLAGALNSIAARVRARRAFGAKATALRKASVAFVKKNFNGRPAGDVAFGTVYETLECVDVKVEAGSLSGAASCAKKLARLLRENAPAKPPVTFGSDLTGTPFALEGQYPEDSGFWTDGVRVPADGMLTGFRLKVGSNPVAVTVRFSVVRPQADGRVKVITTTDPRLQVAARTPRTYSVSSSSLSFNCCRVQKGDIVAVTTSGADQTQSPFTWFAERTGVTTMVHESPVPGSRDQDPGVMWSFQPRRNLETLLQVVLAPS